jgi:transcriptional regulator with XRE-family HTH domain
MSADEATIQSLRRDLALQVSRIASRSGDTQINVARRLGIPQPTLSKIKNGRVHDLSIELLLRIAIRAGLVLTVQTGRDSSEAGVFVSSFARGGIPADSSKLAAEARSSLEASEKLLSPAERLEAFLQHNQLMAELHRAGRTVHQRRERNRQKFS